MFSTTTSAVLTRASNIARPRGAFRFSVTPFLLEFSSRKNHASSPRLSESAVRPGSPPGASILMTSAPSHASIWVQEGPASYWVRSRTRIPSRAFGMMGSPVDENVTDSSIRAALGVGLRQQVGDANRDARREERPHRRGRSQRLDAAVAPAIARRRRRVGFAVDLDAVVDDVDEPALGDRAARVKAELVLAVGAIRGLRDLDHQHGTRRVSVAVRVRIARHQEDVGLGLRGIVEGEGQLRVDLPGAANGRTEGVQHLADGRGVPAALRFTNDERAVEQLEPLARLEHAQVDQTFVLDAGPAAGAWSGLYRRCHLIELRAVEDGGYETPLHRIDPEPEPFQRVGAQDFEVAWLTEQAEGVEGPALERDQDFGESTLGRASFNREDASTLCGLQAEVPERAPRHPR